jgi:hypothetical protein
MGMRIDKTGHYNPTTRIQAWLVGVGILQFASRPNCNDLFILDQDSPIGDYLELAQV